MRPSRETALELLASAVVEMDQDLARTAAHRALREGIAAYDAISEGLNAGMARVNTLFERHEYFIPELLLCSDAMYAGLEVLRPHLRPGASGNIGQTVVIGVVQGDTHDIGKNIVSTMLEASGFEVIDLGRDVPAERFIEAAHQNENAVVALSTLMTSTMQGMASTVAALSRTHRTIVGGAPVSPGFAQRIGASAYAQDAAGAVREVKLLSEVGR